MGPEHGFAVGGVAPDEHKLGTLVADHPVDVVLVAAPLDGFAAWREVAASSSSPAVVHVVAEADLARARTAAQDSDVSVLAANASPETLRTAVRAAALGLRVTSRAAAIRSARKLTARECEVLALLADGVGNKLISRRLGISPNTVKFHVSAILEKLSAATRTEAVAIALRSGLLTH